MEVIGFTETSVNF